MDIHSDDTSGKKQDVTAFEVAALVLLAISLIATTTFIVLPAVAPALHSIAEHMFSRMSE